MATGSAVGANQFLDESWTFQAGDTLGQLPPPAVHGSNSPILQCPGSLTASLLVAGYDQGALTHFFV